MQCLTGISIFLALYRVVFCDFASSQTSIISRSKRYLVFPPPGAFAPSKVQLILGLGLPMEVDVSMIIGYVMKFNYALPSNASYLTNPYVRYDRSINHDDEPDESDDPATDGKDEVPSVSRWELYEILANALGSPRSGKACLLRAICDAAAVPFNRDHGLTSQLIHLFLAPSSTSEPFKSDFDREYHGAEIAGRQDARACDNLFPECAESLLEYFTEVHG